MNNLYSLSTIWIGEFSFFWTSSLTMTGLIDTGNQCIDLYQLQTITLGKWVFVRCHSIVFEGSFTSVLLT